MQFVNVVAGLIGAVLIGFVCYVEGRGVVRVVIGASRWIRQALQRHRAKTRIELEGS